MANNNWIEMLSVWGLFLLAFALVMIPIAIGQRLGQVKKLRGEIHDAPIGSVVGAALGLLAFMLAFTFQITANRYDTRKQLLLDEVTAIRTTYLRAALLPEPHRTDSKKLLREYVDLSLKLVSDPGFLQQALSRSQELHTALWKEAEALAELDRSSEVYALFTSSLNDVIDLHNRRVTVALQYRIPSTILWVLFFITFFSMMALGYQFGISGKGNMIINVVLALIFSAEMWLIFALDRPETGIIKVNPLPLITLQQQLRENP